MSLRQGDMSVREYEARFNDLSRFAPSLVESEDMKCLKFEGGPQELCEEILGGSKTSELPGFSSCCYEGGTG